MSNWSDVASNIDLVKKTYKKHLSLGEGAAANDFRMTFEGYPDMEFLVQAAQIPEIKREKIEGFGPMGVEYAQYGKIKNKLEGMTCTFKEVVSGGLYNQLREIVREKKYLKVILALVSESLPTSNSSNTWVIEDCVIEVDATELSVEDGTTLVKPQVTLTGCVFPEESEETLSWE